MNYIVIVSEVAEAEAADAFLQLARLSPDFAGRWYSGLLDIINTLDIFPTRCAVAPENDDFPEAEVRQLIYRKSRAVYRILFRIIEPDTVLILHVRHSARQYGQEQSEDE